MPFILSLLSSQQMFDLEAYTLLIPAAIVEAIALLEALSRQSRVA